jgi:holin-like protein
VILALVVSTLLTLAVTAAVTRAVMQWQRRREGQSGVSGNDATGAPDA